MAFDILIRNGTLVDGTGAEPRSADVAIVGDRVVEVGVVEGDALWTIDATDRLVTPGFVDCHTHLDAQIGWDPDATSSCYHGVTSVVLGNCGVTFAPCKPADRGYLAEMMESVEDIPAGAILDGLSWDWETYGEYLNMLDGLPKGLNVGGMVGHSAVRYHAMGARSMEQDSATADDVRAMRELVEEAMQAGALGFSTSRSRLHRVGGGRYVPSRYATRGEVAALADVLRAAGSGVIEIATDVDHRDVAPEYPKSVGEVDWLAELSEVVGRPVTFGMAQSRAMPGLDDAILAAVHRARGRGVDLRPQTTARGVGVLYSLRSRTPWDRATEWQELRPLGVEQRLDRLRDAVARERLVDGAETSLDLAEVYIMPSGDARYDQGSAQSIAVVARRAGTTPADVFIDLSLETDGRALLNWPFLNHDLDAVAGMLDDPAVLLGLGDAGAHVGMIMDASQPTFLLTYWVRERRRFGIAEAVRRLTSDAAELFGIVDRGVLRPGAFADVNVVHFEGLRLPVPEYVQDFPQGAGRFVQRALGYDMTLVNGKVAVAHGEPTAAKAGRVLRSR